LRSSGNTTDEENRMYSDDPPELNVQASQVIVVEPGDTNAKLIMQEAVHHDAVSTDADGEDIYWVVFDNDPGRAWDFTEKTLRVEIEQRAAA